MFLDLLQERVPEDTAKSIREQYNSATGYDVWRISFPGNSQRLRCLPGTQLVIGKTFYLYGRLLATAFRESISGLANIRRPPL
jgi:hypothetical protein